MSLDEQQYFYKGRRFSKHKMTKYAKNLEGMLPFDPPGYAYGRSATLTQQWLYLNFTSRVDKYHAFSEKIKEIGLFSFKPDFLI